MAVDTLKDNIEIELLSSKGWFGAKAGGSFGQVEGWIQLAPGSALPDAYLTSPAANGAILCARDIDDKLIVY